MAGNETTHGRLAPGAVADLLAGQVDSWSLPAPTWAAAVFDRNGVIAFHSAACDERFAAPARTDVFRIASMSKSFLAACALVLVQRGQLDLDAPVSRYVEEFSDPASGTVTVRMLLSNCSGLPEDNAWIDYHLGLPMAEFRAMTDAGYRFTEAPGQVYQYSNVGFALAGQIVEAVAGMPYEDFVRAELLSPLGLSDTRYRADDYGDGHVLAIGRSSFDEGRTWEERPFVGSGAPAPAGSLFSTVDDIAAWCGWLSSAREGAGPAGPAAAMLARGASAPCSRPSVTPANEALLSSGLRAQMQRIQTSIHSMQDRVATVRNDAIGYGLGVMVEEDNRFGTIVQHSGGLPGYSTNMRWHVDSGLGVVAYATTEAQPMVALAAGLLDEVLRAGDVPARRIPLWPETIAAARRIDAMLLSGGEHGIVADLFSPNVFSDVPEAVRTARFRALADAAGGLASEVPPLEERLRWSVSSAQLVWSLPCQEGAVQVRIELAEVPGVPVQRLVIEEPDAELARVPAGRDLVVRHYLPVVVG